jgi:hypothetical protein
MTALTSAQITRVWSDGAADLAALYRVSRVTAGDTVDIGPSGASPDFQLVKQAAMLATTISGTAACSVSGTVITFPAGLSADAGYLLVWGDTN